MSLALDAAHDLYLDAAGLIATVSGADAVAQNVLTALRLFKGEWHLAVNRGVDWRGEILVAHPDIRAIEFQLRRTVLSVPDVTGVREMSLDFDRGQRDLTISLQIDTVYGPSGVIQP